MQQIPPEQQKRRSTKKQKPRLDSSHLTAAHFLILSRLPSHLPSPSHTIPFAPFAPCCKNYRSVP
jgi:hypothetical protein